MKVEATHKYMHAPPKKVRRFGSLLKGENVRKADAILQTKASQTCEKLRKLLRSAVANAEHNNGLSRQNLVVKNVIANQGPRYKRIRPRARGRAFLERKRTTHATIIVETEDTYRKRELEKKQRRGMAKAKKARGRSPQETADSNRESSGESGSTATATASETDSAAETEEQTGETESTADEQSTEDTGNGETSGEENEE